MTDADRIAELEEAVKVLAEEVQEGWHFYNTVSPGLPQATWSNETTAAVQENDIARAALENARRNR